MIHTSPSLCRFRVLRMVVAPVCVCLLLIGCEPNGVGTIKGKAEGKPSMSALLPAPDGKVPKKGIPPLSGPIANVKSRGR
jgi:hypothetical protein